VAGIVDRDSEHHVRESACSGHNVPDHVRRGKKQIRITPRNVDPRRFRAALRQPVSQTLVGVYYEQRLRLQLNEGIEASYAKYDICMIRDTQ